MVGWAVVVLGSYEIGLVYDVGGYCVPTCCGWYVVHEPGETELRLVLTCPVWGLIYGVTPYGLLVFVPFAVNVLWIAESELVGYVEFVHAII